MKSIIHSIISSHALRIVSGLVLGIFFASCSSPSDGPGNITWNNAKQGSIYIFKDYRIDSLGRLSTPIIEVDSVVTSGVSIGGKANASEVLETVAGSIFSGFSYYIAYDANGDFELGDSSFSAMNGFNWIIFPTGSQRTNVIVDTSEYDSLYSHRYSYYEAISYVGWESVQAAGKNFNAIKIKVENRYRDYGIDSSETVEYFWFVPEIGFFVKAEEHHTDSSFDYYGRVTTTTSGGMFVLDSYTLR